MLKHWPCTFWLCLHIWCKETSRPEDIARSIPNMLHAEYCSVSYALRKLPVLSIDIDLLASARPCIQTNGCLHSLNKSSWLPNALWMTVPLKYYGICIETFNALQIFFSWRDLFWCLLWEGGKCSPFFYFEQIGECSLITKTSSLVLPNLKKPLNDDYYGAIFVGQYLICCIKVFCFFFVMTIPILS